MGGGVDWDKLRVFHTVADVGSLTHAGEQLHLSQSAMSRQIRGLEDQLEAVLFHRHARGLLLTEQGEILYDATRSIAQLLNAAATRIRDSKDEAWGSLRVTTTAGFGALWLLPRLKRLFQEHPHLSIDVLMTEAVLDLPMREADVAIRLSPPNQAEVIRRPLMEITMQLFASAEYLSECGAPREPADLAGHRVITYGSEAPQIHEAADWLRRRVDFEKTPNLVLNDYGGVLRAAQDGVGIAVLPSYVAPDHPELVMVLPEEASPPIQVYFVYPEELRRSQRVLAFRDFLLGELSAGEQHTGESNRVAGMT